MSSMQAYCQQDNYITLVTTLDSVLAASDGYIKAKEARIEQLRKKISPIQKEEERLWLNKMLYDEYAVYKADSAMYYVNENIRIARNLGRESDEYEWRVNKVFLLAAQGLLTEAEREMMQIDEKALAPDVRYVYLETAIYLCSHLSQYIGHSNGMAERYDSISDNLRHRALELIDSSHPAYYSLKASMLKDPLSSEWKNVKLKLKQVLDKAPLNSRISAINAYYLALMCKAEGNEDDYTMYLIKSAIADIRSCNRDIASLEELANVCYQKGDIDRGYAYINYCLKVALLYPNRVRVMNISLLMDKLQEAAEQRNIGQEHKLSNMLLVLSILSGVLLLVMVVTFIQFLKLKHSHERLMESKAMQSKQLKELHETQERLSNVNHELTIVNEKLLQSNDELLKSNYVKEEYVGYVFSICSSYLTKIEDFRKDIARKLKTGKIENVRSLITSPQIGQDELREFYHRFDTTFLHIYPNFVEDFNSLIRPEEQVKLKNGELLNTELRIYALVRLGINDSVKISEFLHVSPQTVYNNRLKTRNKAIVPKEEFCDRIRQIGKNCSTEE